MRWMLCLIRFVSGEWYQFSMTRRKSCSCARQRLFEASFIITAGVISYLFSCQHFGSSHHSSPLLPPCSFSHGQTLRLTGKQFHAAGSIDAMILSHSGVCLFVHVCARDTGATQPSVLICSSKRRCPCSHVTHRPEPGRWVTWENGHVLRSYVKSSRIKQN